MTPTSPIEQIRIKAEQLKAVAEVLADYSNITDLYERNRYRNDGISVLYARPYRWDRLTDGGRGHQQQFHEEYKHFREIVRVILNGRIKQTLDAFEKNDKIISRFAIHEDAGSSSVPRELANLKQAVERLVSLVGEGQDASDRRVVVVPDTNALLHNPQIESWVFDGFPKFRIIMMPTVLQELDQLKVVGRVEELRKKSESLIRRLKEYQRRGPWHRGIIIRKGG